MLSGMKVGVSLPEEQLEASAPGGYREGSGGGVSRRRRRTAPGGTGALTRRLLAGLDRELGAPEPARIAGRTASCAGAGLLRRVAAARSLALDTGALATQLERGDERVRALRRGRTRLS